MDGSDELVLFFGDLSDPWVESIAASVSRSCRLETRHCADSLPEHAFDPTCPPARIVLHRQRLTTLDVERVRAWREPFGLDSQGVTGVGGTIARTVIRGPEIILCAGPYVRYEDLEHSSSLFDRLVSEATAAQVLPLWLSRETGGRRRRFERVEPSFRIEILCRDENMREMIRDACHTAGYRAMAIDDRMEESHRSPIGGSQALGPHRVLTIWELPVLEPGWNAQLEARQRRTGPVIALAGFASRDVVETARASGAFGCLDLPCDLDDLFDLIERVAVTWRSPIRVDPSHELPPPARGRGVERASRRNVTASAWPEPGPSSTIPRSTAISAPSAFDPRFSIKRS